MATRSRARPATPDSQAEAKVIREVFAVAPSQTDILDALLVKFSLWKTLRVCAWMAHFIRNLRGNKVRRSKGPLTTEKIEIQRHLWLKRTQDKSMRDKRFESIVKVGEVELIKLEDKDHGKWKVGIVTELIEGRDGVVWGASCEQGLHI